MYRRLLGLIVLAAAVVLLPAKADEPKADDKGWVQLFNGKDLTGWKLHPNPNPQITGLIGNEKDGKVIAIHGKQKDGKVVPLWRVEDGILIGSGPASHLFSERGDYRNFQYRVEAMI